MNFRIGRDNFALTVMAPYDCGNNCSFCTAKDTYHRLGTNVEDVKFQMERVLKELNFPIKDVVFTGGEPMTNLDVLREMIDIVPADMNIYINTTLIPKNFEEFKDLVNDEPKIKGINVSRHTPTIDEDRQFYSCEIVGDEGLRLFKKPIRINCVLTDEYELEYKKIIERWMQARKDINSGISLCFRENFAALTLDAKTLQRENLHNPYTPFLMDLGKEYLFVDHSQCNVCDTTRFMTPGGLVVAYHRGLEKSSVLSPDEKTLEINDLVIFPNGEIGYDWKDISLKTMHECEIWFSKQMKHLSERISNLFGWSPMDFTQCASPVYQSSGPICGGGGYCGSSDTIRCSTCGGGHC